MTGKVQPEKKNFEFILTIEPKEKLTEEQNSILFRENIQRISRTGIYTRRSTNFLATFLCMDELENENTSLGLNQLEYTLTKKEMK